MRRIRCLIASLAIIVAPKLAHAQCFTPLSTPSSNNIIEWRDLADLDRSAEAPGLVEIQRIADGYGDKINLDFYSVTFRRHASRPISDIFAEIRRNFGSFGHTEPSVFEEGSDTYFLPYRSSSRVDDPARERNASLWGSANPQGALMTFVLATYAPALLTTATLQGTQFVQEQGDVIAVCASATDFIFRTARTEKNGYHPVSGSRGFGIKDNGDGTWTFYTKGADREVGVNVGGTTQRYIGNTILSRGVRSPVIPGSILNPNHDAVFQAGHNFWLEFFSNLMLFVERRGMTVDRSTFITNSKRYTYPL